MNYKELLNIIFYECNVNLNDKEKLEKTIEHIVKEYSLVYEKNELDVRKYIDEQIQKMLNSKICFRVIIENSHINSIYDSIFIDKLNTDFYKDIEYLIDDNEGYEISIRVNFIRKNILGNISILSNGYSLYSDICALFNQINNYIVENKPIENISINLGEDNIQIIKDNYVCKSIDDIKDFCKRIIISGESSLNCSICEFNMFDINALTKEEIEKFYKFIKLVIGEF